MLCLTRIPGDRITIGDDIEIRIDRLDAQMDKPWLALLSISAPPGTPIYTFVRSPLTRRIAGASFGPRMEKVLLGRGGGDPVQATLRYEQAVCIGPGVQATVIGLGTHQCRLGIRAPRGTGIRRSELPTRADPRVNVRPVVRIQTEVAH